MELAQKFLHRSGLGNTTLAHGGFFAALETYGLRPSAALFNRLRPAAQQVTLIGDRFGLPAAQVKSYGF